MYTDVAFNLPEGLSYAVRQGFAVNGVQAGPLHCFLAENRAMLLNAETGTSLFLPSREAVRVMEEDLSPALSYRLVSAGLARAEGSPQVCSRAGDIAPSFFLIDMTNICNFGCDYCLRVPEEQGRKITGDMLENICGYILAYCLRHGRRRITVQPWGGEPLLCLDRILDIRRFFERHPEVSVRITVETNGSLLTPSAAEALFANGIEISVSFDGPPAIHDSQRRDRAGLPTSQSVRMGVEAARAAGYRDLGGICVLTEKSVGHVREILDYADRVLRVRGLKLNPMHRPAYPCSAVPVTGDGLSSLAREIVQAVRDIRREGRALHETGTADRLMNLLFRTEGNICHSCGCCGGRRMVSFDMDGGIYPCELTDWPDERLGTITDGRDLDEMIAAAIPGRAYFREKKKEACGRCPWWYYCRGGCSSAVKYLGREGDTADECECRINCAMYPLLVRLLLDYPDEAKGWLD